MSTVSGFTKLEDIKREIEKAEGKPNNNNTVQTAPDSSSWNWKSSLKDIIIALVLFVIVTNPVAVNAIIARTNSEEAIASGMAGMNFKGLAIQTGIFAILLVITNALSYFNCI